MVTHQHCHHFFLTTPHIYFLSSKRFDVMLNLLILSRVTDGINFNHNTMQLDPNIPFFEDKESPTQKDKPTVERKTINAIVYNPKTNQFICLDWKDFGWKTTIIGGFEHDESPEAAGRREVAEETGYTDLEYKGEITKFYTSFYAAHKNENRLADTTAVLFILLGDIQQAINAEETKNHTFSWVDKDTVLTYLNVEPQIFAMKKALDILG